MTDNATTRILYFDISDFCSRSTVSPDQVLFFLKNPTVDFFSLLLKGVDGNMVWDVDPNRVYQNKEDVFQYLLERFEEMNLIDERSGIFSGTGYSGTIDYFSKKLDYYSERFYTLLVPIQGGKFKVEDISISGSQLVILLRNVPN